MAISDYLRIPLAIGTAGLSEVGFALADSDDKKKAKSKPKNYTAEDTTATESWAKEQKTKEDYLAGLEEQVSEAGKAEGLLGEAEQKAGRALRRRAAQSLASLQGRAPGSGGQLAAMRGTAIERGIAEGALSSEFAEKKAAARRLAAEAKTELAAEQRKMLEQEKGRGVAKEAALTRAQEELDKVGATVSVYMDEDDYEKAAKNIEDNVLAYETDPEIREKLKEFIADVRAGNVDTAGAIG